MKQLRTRAGWLLMLLAGFFGAGTAGGQQFYYFETNQFPRYEGGTISGTLHRAVLDSLSDVCILLYTNVSGITPVNTATDVSGLPTPPNGACYQPNNPTVLAHFNSGSYTATFSLGVVNNGSVQTERGAVLYMDAGWAPPAPSTNYIQQAWIFLEDNDSPVTVSRAYSAVPEGFVNSIYFERSTNCIHAPLTVHFTLSGSSTLNTDYQISAPAPFNLVTGTTNELTIPEWYSYGQVDVTVLRDSLVEGDETVTARVEPNAAQYTMPGTATTTITNWDDTSAVSVSLINPKLTEGAGQIGIVVSRSAPVYIGGNSLPVNLSIGGTATAGTDYTPSLSTSVTIPSSQFSVTNWITPLADTNVEGVETVSVTVLPGSYYVVDAQSNAVAYIQDDYPIINVQATDNYAAEPGSNPGSFLITRIGNLSKAVTVQLNITGTAVTGVDYAALPTNVTLAAGISTTNLAVTTLTNDGPETAETVVLSLKTNASYVLGLYTNAVVTIIGEGPVARDAYPKGERYVRGTGTNYNLLSMVIPLQGLKGTRRNDLEFIGYNTAYHYDATNSANQLYATNRIPFNTPIASFGEGWGTPLYLGQSYSLGLFQGLATLDPIIIYAFRRSDGGLEGTTTITQPASSTSEWVNFVTNGITRTVSGYGLTTVLRNSATMNWGTDLTGWALTHTATDEATNYTFLIAWAGVMNGQYAALTVSNQPAYGYFYDLTFGARPGWRSVFVDQPHFQTTPLPPDLLNKTPDELLNFGAVVTNTVSLSPSACTNLDQSPELRRHPILDQFVADLNKDPLALANYVQNEIGLTDPMAYREDGQVESESINQGGVNRGAVGVYLEGQGSPMEQCALLVYLMRQAGYPATYVFPPEGGLKMLDKRLSTLMRMRINDARDDRGRYYTTNQLIAVNYPWVATYISNQWVHVFPWLKDYAVEEGLDVYDFLPAPYKQTQLWVKDYVLGKTNITAFATLTDDTPGTIFPRWLDNALKQSAPGISLDDIGMRYRNRRHLYAQWADFPRPTWVTNTCTTVESLGSSSITNVSPTLTNIFDTVQVELYSVANPQKRLLIPPLRTADLHNRKFYLTHTNLGGGQIQAQLILGPYQPNATGTGSFSTGDTTLTNRQVLTLTLDDTDDNLKLWFRHRRQRTLTWETALDPSRKFLNLAPTREVLLERAIRKGSVVGICLTPGRVTPAMLRVHAQELWSMEQMLSTNSVATNQVTADVYQGSLVYLVGMSYYERVARGDEFLQRLFKVRQLSQFAMGISKLDPRRNPDGSLYSGPLDPIWPNIDMFFTDVVGAGNGSVRPDSGWDIGSVFRDYFNLLSANMSAQEHATLNTFFGQSNSVSTVKLLQLAQSKTANGGSNVVELNYYNYQAAGEVIYNGTALKNHDPEIWSQVIDAFQGGLAGDYTVGWITPGTQTTTSGSFSGMSAFLVGPYRQDALIGNNQYGGYADALPYSSVSAGNTPWIEIRGDGEGNYTTTFSSPSANQRLPGNEVTTYFDILSDYLLYNNNAYAPNPAQNFEGAVNGLVLNGASGTYQDSIPAETDLGVLGTGTDYRGGNGFISQVEDPVNALTGEFYIDAVDLSLPGPMPLQIRRNYGSHNVAENQIGFGWKLNYMPYLSVANVSNIIYEAEPDGSVLAFAPIGTNLWAPTLALNPTLNNNGADGIGSVANRLNARLAKSSTNYFLTGGDGSLRVFQEMSFPLTNSASWDRFRPYLTFWYDNRSNFYRFEYGTNALQSDYGQVRRVVSSSGNILRFQYDPYGRVVDAYSLDGRRVQYDYDNHGDLMGVTLPDTSEISYEYQLLTWSTNSVTNVYSTHLLVKELKPDGRTLKNEYDGQRRVTNQWSTVGPDLRLVRNATFRYTNDFNLTNLTATLNGTTTILDYTNNPTTYFYTNSLIRRIRDPLNSELVQEWYEANETNAPAYPRSLKTLNDKRGLVTTFLYDPRGNVTNTTSRGDLLGDGNTNATATTLAFYDTNNLPVRTVDASGTTNLYFYTNTWLLARLEIWPSNASPTQAITNLFAYTDVTNADGTASYGLRVREIRAALSSEAATNEWVYGSRGFPIKQTRYTSTADPAVIITNLFNTRGELAVQTDAAGRRTALGYDPRGNLQSLEIFEAGQSIPISWDYLYYNENGELTWSDGPRFNPEDYVWRDYDGAGRQTQEIQWRAQAKFDGSGVEAAPGDDLYATTFLEYDAFNNLTKATDARGNYSRKQYDALGRLLREEFYDVQGSLLATNGFAYNLAGDLTNAFNPLGGSVQRQYTSTGKPKFQRNADGSTNVWLYYADGRLRREIQNNGAYWEHTYDDANRRMTLTFRSAAGTTLATNVSELDRRGNRVKFTDAGGFVFTNLFDGLDRIKIAAGPPIVTVKEDCGPVPGCGNWVTNILQQKLTSFYDSAGVWQTNINALGEKSISRFDALGRTARSEVRAANDTLVRETSITYSLDHHGVTLTNGSGASVLVNSAFTDNDGQTVLSIAYPYANVREFTRNEFDAVGNSFFSGRYAVTNAGAPFFFVGSISQYDGLNRLASLLDRDDALTTFHYNAAGNLTNRTMPGGLQWNAIYNNAGQVLQDWNAGSGGSGTRTNTYVYYPVGNPFAGLLHTNIDGRAITCTHYYDDWLRPVTNLYLDTFSRDHISSWQYDARGLVTQISEDPGPGETIVVHRAHDAYGQLIAEDSAAEEWGTSASQDWDAAGRRTRLGFGGDNYSFNWRADGRLASVANPNGSASYGYNTAGILTNRLVGSRNTSINSLDGVGRPLSIVTKVGLLPKLTEALAWTGDGLISSHTLGREDFTNATAYTYAPATRRLVEERLNVDATKRWTNSFTFDGGTAGGPGALTRIAGPSTSPQWSGSLDNFARNNTETNTSTRRQAFGRVNGNATITASLDGQPMSVRVDQSGNSLWPKQWWSLLELNPGTHQLVVSAAHPSGKFTTNTSVWFTNAATGETVFNSYDTGGYLTSRIWKNASGQTNRMQGLLWDHKGRLTQVLEVDANKNGFHWATAYDGLNRRARTYEVGISNSVYLFGTSERTITHYYDPLVEFLELGITVDSATTWKLYGPDLDGAYGGLNGTGGLEGTSTGIGAFQPTISDARGNVLGQATNSFAVRWTAARVTGYGAVPGHRPLPLGRGGDVAESSAWRGRYVETAGYVWLGGRFYNPESGSFLNTDPVWNGRDPNYYTFAGGDPINYFDPDGRMGRNHDAASALYMELYNAWQQEVQVNYIASVAGASATGDIGRMANALAGGSLSQFDDFLVDLLKGGSTTAAGFIPYVGDAMDVYTVGAPDSSKLDRTLSGVSLTANAWTAGLLPNYGPIRRGLARMADAFSHVPHPPHIPTPPSIPHTPHTPHTPTPPSAPHTPSTPDVPTPSRAGPLPPGEQPYQLTLFADEPYSRTKHYGNTPNTAQRNAAAPDSFDHNPPLVQHYYEGDGLGGLPGYNLTQTERKSWAHSLESGSPASQAAQDAQGGTLSGYSKRMKKQHGH